MTQPTKSHFLAVAILLVTAIPAGLAAGQKPSTSKGKGAQPAGKPAMVARGKIIYRERCEICHYSNSEALKVGPGLKGIYRRGKFANGAKVDDASMEKWVLDGGKNMPPFKGELNPFQISDLIAYLRTL